MEERKIDVIMCVYKESLEIIRVAIESILEQTYSNFQFIIVVDSPNRNDLLELLTTYKKNDQRIELIINDKNSGLVYSLNKALEKCSGEYIARMDADDISEKYRLELQVAQMEREGVDIVGARICVIDQKGDILTRETKYPSTFKYVKKYLHYKNCIPHPTWLVRKEVYKQLGGYRDISPAEDYDFLIRAIMMNYSMSVIPQICLKYRKSLKGISTTNKGTQQFLTRFLPQQLYDANIYSIESIQKYINEQYQVVKNIDSFYKNIAYLKNLKMTRGNLNILRKVVGSRELYYEIKVRILCGYYYYADYCTRKFKGN